MLDSKEDFKKLMKESSGTTDNMIKVYQPKPKPVSPPPKSVPSVAPVVAK